MKKLILASIFIFMSFCSTYAGQLAGGEYHSLVLKQDGTVWSWGQNSLGELGDGTTSNRLTPVQVIGLTDVISISAGSEHSLALKRDGTVWAWGNNWLGQLGNGTIASYYPTPGQMIGLSGVISIAGGIGDTLALKNDGTVWSCGMNRNGQLGDGTTTDRSTPVQVIGLSEVIIISGGGEHSLALKNDGTVWAWGDNTSGQLGDGNGGWEPSSPTNYSTVPVQTIGLSNVTAIAGGSSHSLAIKSDGTIWAWGHNGWGQLGNGSGGESPYTNYISVPVQVTGLSGIIAIDGGGYYSLALTSYGTVWFWGQMEWGGNIWSAIPVPVNGISSVKAIAGGSYHVLVLKNEGTIWAWGNNDGGQLGDGTTQFRVYPVQVQGLSLAASSAPASVLAADFDADGRADPTAVTSSGEWFFWHSSSSYSRDGPIELGMSGTPAAGDVDGDGIGDMALVDPSTGSGQAGNWFFFLSSHGYALDGPYAFGVIGTPVLADFDGDSKADPAIYEVASGKWQVFLSADGYSPVSATFAISGGTPLAGDFDGDGRADPVMVDSSGNWYFWLSGSMYTRQGPYNFGLTGMPVAGDFDGDRKADPAIMDSSGNWNFWLSGSFYTRDGPYYLVLP